MTPERIERIHESLKDKVVKLHSDPASQGPKYLQDLIARTRGYLNDVGVVLQEVLQEKHALERQLRRLKALFEIDYDQHLANNEEVTSQPSIDDRRAKVNTILVDQRREIVSLETELADLTAVETAVKFRHKELDHTMSAIRLQKNLIDTEIGSGAMYGDETPEGRKNLGGSSPLMDEEDLEDLFSGMDDEGETEESVDEGETEEAIEVEGIVEDEDLSELFPGEGQSATSDPVLDTQLSNAQMTSLVEDLPPDDVDLDEDDMIKLVREKKDARKVAREEYGRKRPEIEKTPNGLVCVVCGSPQYDTIHGTTCDNGHGGAGGRSENDPPPEVPDPQSLVEEAEPDPKPSDDSDSLDDFMDDPDFSEFFNS